MRRVPWRSLPTALLPFAATLLAVGLGITGAPPFAHGASYTTVNLGGDTDDGSCQPLNFLSARNCTLREAINAANADATADTIAFVDIAAAAGSVSPTSLLPTIINPLTIDGAIASGKFRIDGASAGALADGLRATASLTVRNLIVTRFSDNGIQLDAGAGFVSGSVIGTDATGTPGLGNGRGILTANGTLAVIDSTVSGNVSTGPGGGIYKQSGTAFQLSNSIVSGNTADDGGGIFIEVGGPVTFSNSTVTGNTTFGYGGGILKFASNDVLTLFNCTVSGNTAAYGGGIYSEFGSVILDSSTVSDNVADLGAGIVHSGTQALTITNSTVSGNVAGSGAGGIYAVSGTVTVSNSTIANNTVNSDANGSGGGISRAGGTVNLGNTILAGNVDSSSDSDCFGALTSQGYNLIQTLSAGCTISGVTTGNVTGQSANLAPLALNAPGTTQTHAVLAGSPAIDAGSPACPLPFSDQRGVARPQSIACDIGAYESPFSAPPAPSVPALPYLGLVLLAALLLMSSISTGLRWSLFQVERSARSESARRPDRRLRRPLLHR